MERVIRSPPALPRPHTDGAASAPTAPPAPHGGRPVAGAATALPGLRSLWTLSARGAVTRAVPVETPTEDRARDSRVALGTVRADLAAGLCLPRGRLGCPSRRAVGSLLGATLTSKWTSAGVTENSGPRRGGRPCVSVGDTSPTRSSTGSSVGAGGGWPPCRVPADRLFLPGCPACTCVERPRVPREAQPPPLPVRTARPPSFAVVTEILPDSHISPAINHHLSLCGNKSWG